ncbi:Retinoblastoma-associated protein [Batrachochytrium dendrobatidis]|nr:Retinoblastoma-associated protein [Batrachochytrium dendrobatidis]
MKRKRSDLDVMDISPATSPTPDSSDIDMMVEKQSIETTDLCSSRPQLPLRIRQGFRLVGNSTSSLSSSLNTISNDQSLKQPSALNTHVSIFNVSTSLDSATSSFKIPSSCISMSNSKRLKSEQSLVKAKSLEPCLESSSLLQRSSGFMIASIGSDASDATNTLNLAEIQRPPLQTISIPTDTTMENTEFNNHVSNHVKLPPSQIAAVRLVALELDLDSETLAQTGRILETRYQSLQSTSINKAHKDIIWSVLAVWIADKCISNKHSFTLSRMVRVIGKHLPYTSGQEFVVNGGLGKLIEELSDLITSFPPHLINRDVHLQLKRCVFATMDTHNRTLIIFKMLDKVLDYILCRSSNQTIMSHIRFMRRFAWTLFLYIRDVMYPEGVLEQVDKALCVLFSLFFASQIPFNLCKPFDEIMSSMGHASLEHTGMTLFDGFRIFSTALIANFQVLEDQVNLLIVNFTHALETCTRNGCLKSDTTYSKKDTFPWCIYVRAFQIERGLLLSNLEDATRLVDSMFVRNRYEIDPMLYLHSQDIVKTTPMRFDRTPRSTTKGLCAGARSLKSAFSASSGLNNIMAGTPLTAKTVLQSVRRRVLAPCIEISSVTHRLNEFVSNYPECPYDCLSRLPALENASASVIQRAKASLETFQSRVPNFDHAWLLGARLYAALASDIAKKGCSRPYESQARLASDSQFHRAMMAVAYEMVRETFNISTKTQNILDGLDIHVVDLALGIDLVVKTHVWIPDSLVKRLKQIEERLLETDIWSSTEFRNWFIYSTGTSTFSKASNIASPCRASTSPPILSELCMLYSDIMPDDVVHDLFKGMPQSMSFQYIQIQLKPFQVIFGKILKLAYTRFVQLTKAMRLQTHIVNMAWRLFDALICNETHLQLLLNRHLDTIMITCIFTYCRFENTPVTFRELLESYNLQPQFMDSVFTQVYMEGEERGCDIVKFYNKVFVPCIKSLLPVLTPLRNEAVINESIPGRDAVKRETTPANSAIDANSIALLCQQTAIERLAQQQQEQQSLQSSPLRHEQSMSHGGLYKPMRRSHMSNLSSFSPKNCSSMASPSKSTLMTPMTKKLVSLGESPFRPSSPTGIPASASRRLALSKIRSQSLPYSVYTALSPRPT